MTASITVISNLLEFIDNCAIDDYLLMVSNHVDSDDEVTNIDVLLDKKGRTRVSFDVSGSR